MTNALETIIRNVKSISISPDDFIYFQKLKSESEKPAHFGDEPLEFDPFNFTVADTILAYRVKILQLLAIKDTMYEHCYLKHQLKTCSNNEFFRVIKEMETKEI